MIHIISVISISIYLTVILWSQCYYIWSLSISRYTYRRSFTTSPPWLWRFTESRLWKSLGATTPNIRLELPSHHEEALPHRAWPNIQNSPEGLLASLNIVVIFKYLQDALRLQDFHKRDVKRAGGIYRSHSLHKFWRFFQQARLSETFCMKIAACRAKPYKLYDDKHNQNQTRVAAKLPSCVCVLESLPMQAPYFDSKGLSLCKLVRNCFCHFYLCR